MYTSSMTATLKLEMVSCTFSFGRGRCCLAGTADSAPASSSLVGVASTGTRDLVSEDDLSVLSMADSSPSTFCDGSMALGSKVARK